LWIPYAAYRESHLRHHRHEGRYLADVERDPESFYWLTSISMKQTGAIRAIAAFNCTLLGRLLVGPAAPSTDEKGVAALVTVLEELKSDSTLKAVRQELLLQGAERHRGEDYVDVLRLQRRAAALNYSQVR
jgi:hypothetical protein